ncbi:MAG: hypothetical protein HY901_18265 [Deltaproteobacteria bacterium]|nr:hypothetical protein [Deltaproteobacteria bacterium]
MAEPREELRTSESAAAVFVRKRLVALQRQAKFREEMPAHFEASEFEQARAAVLCDWLDELGSSK